MFSKLDFMVFQLKFDFVFGLKPVFHVATRLPTLPLKMLPRRQSNELRKEFIRPTALDVTRFGLLQTLRD
jgi:hypothetical protein